MPETFEIRIVEAYRDYQPPFDVKKLVYRLLKTAPGKYLQGLDCIVLTNQGNLSRRDRVGKVWRRGRKASKSDIAGRYYPGSASRSPYIELRIDKISSALPGILRHIPVLRAVVVGHVLFHEVGHHIHYTKRPEYKNKEDVADTWAGKLNAGAIRHIYWYAVPVLHPALKIYKFLRRKQWI